jgi:uncharacterized protein YecE (DUF72 family)
LWWSALVDRFLEEGRTVFAYANNHYQNHSPSTLERFLELRRGDGGAGQVVLKKITP